MSDGLPGGLPTAPGGGNGGGSSSSSGSSGSSSSSGGSSSSSGGSSGPSEAERKAIANAMKSMQNTLLQWGMPLTPQLKNLIARLAKQGASSAAFLQAVRATKDYAAAFPGLRRRDGSLRMSEAQYLAGYNSAKDFAATTGRALSKGAYGFAVKNGNSPNEIRAKIQAVDTMKQNSEVLNEFGQYLVATGAAKAPPKREDLLKFVMKQGPAAWETAWQTAFTASQIEKYAGLDTQVGRGEDISYKGLEKLLKSAPPGTDPTKIDWSETARIAAATLPASRLYGLGITKKDLLKLQLGSPEAVAIEARVKLAQATAEAAGSEQRANPELTRQGQYQGSPRVQATE